MDEAERLEAPGQPHRGEAPPGRGPFARPMLMVAASAVLIICLLLFWYTVQVFLLVFAGVLLAIFLRGLSERDGHSRAIARGETVSSASVARRRGTGEGAKAVWGKLRGGSASGRADTPGAPSPEG